MKLSTLRHPLLYTLPLWICAAAPLRADVTVRYESDMKMTSLMPSPAGDQAEKARHDRMSGMMRAPLRMKNGKSWTSVGQWTYIVDYTSQQLTLLDKEHKTFTKLPSAEFSVKMGERMAAIMPQMPAAMKESMEAMKTSVESKKTGRTDTIQGIQAEEREVVMSVEMPNLMPGASETGMSLKMVMQIWTARPEEALRNQAVREFTGYSIYANQFMNPLAAMQKMMGSMPGFAEVFKPLAGEMSQNNAMMLRWRMAIYMPLSAAMRKRMAESNPSGGTIDPDAPFMQMTQEAVEVSSAPVEESIFQVPADYQTVPADEFLKSMMAEQMSGLGSPAK